MFIFVSVTALECQHLGHFGSMKNQDFKILYAILWAFFPFPLQTSLGLILLGRGIFSALATISIRLRGAHCVLDERLLEGAQWFLASYVVRFLTTFMKSSIKYHFTQWTRPFARIGHNLPLGTLTAPFPHPTNFLRRVYSKYQILLKGELLREPYSIP